VPLHRLLQSYTHAQYASYHSGNKWESLNKTFYSLMTCSLLLFHPINKFVIIHCSEFSPIDKVYTIYKTFKNILYEPLFHPFVICDKLMNLFEQFLKDILFHIHKITVYLFFSCIIDLY